MNRLRVVIGSTLRAHRHARGQTLRQVADAAGVSLTYLSEVERGVKEASSEVLEAVCAALGLALAELLFEVGETLVRMDAPRPGVPIGFRRPDPEPEPGREAQILDFQAFAAARRPA